MMLRCPVTHYQPIITRHAKNTFATLNDVLLKARLIVIRINGSPHHRKLPKNLGLHIRNQFLLVCALPLHPNPGWPQYLTDSYYSVW